MTKRRILILLACLPLLAASGPCTPKPGYVGVCTGDDALTGVTVVIDFQQLDGNGGTAAPTIVRCSPNPNPGTPRTGLKALEDAGIELAGVQQWGLGFICRIEGRPSATETIPVNGMPGYKEACIVTPPAGAYWSYWHADGSGQPWQYSSFGVMNRNVIPGGFEGWSFSLHAGPTTNPKPEVTPYNPAVDPQAPTVNLSINDLDRTIALGQSTSLTWTSTNAVTLQATSVLPATGGGGWSGTLAKPGGTRTITPTARGSYLYTITATGSNGAVTASAVLTVT